MATDKKKRKKEILRSMSMDEIKENLNALIQEMQDLDGKLTSKFGNWKSILFFCENEDVVRYSKLNSEKNLFQELVDRYGETS